ncbi:cation diffusion facilitator family transporter [Ruminococcus albus]|uniref:Cation diffusion facilitator family transporter n=1 Tax=Ruminococcus albus TaxID=1264 RepID=A0A1I1KL43_RUMAL|nr:cation diffusion facilitator family transporter [Ruminococcus albus]SFC61391.1 cation diffusion facilitator family transporter [Ruminococcus albus]
MSVEIINTENKHEKEAMKVSVVSIIVNIALSLLKLLAGILAKSGAMISDAVHSASDVFSTFVVIIGVKLAGKQPDKEHPYGHERMECVASVILAVVLAGTGIGIGYKGIEKIAGSQTEKLVVPGALALGAAVISIIAKELMFHYTKRTAVKINSGALMADAWHHRSDALSSIGSFAGILGARMGLPVLDPLASVIICVFIEKAALEIFIDAVNKMIDKSCSDDTITKMQEVILGTEGVLGIDELKTRLFGAKIYVEVEIRMDPAKTLVEAHDTAEMVHDSIEAIFPEVKHCMVHVNPDISE